MALKAISQALFQALNKVARHGRKPPVLEGDMNFIELNFPELTFVRVNDKIPCLATASGIGDIYFCPEVVGEGHKMHSKVIICNTLKFEDIEDEICYSPCLVPEGGRYAPPVPLESRFEPESTGEVARVKITPIEGVFTDYGTEAMSQFIAIKEFLTGDPDFDPEVGRNVLTAVLNALKYFEAKYSICAREGGEEFLREWEDRIFAALGRRTLEKILPREIFEKDLPLLSCEYLHSKEYPSITNPNFRSGYASSISFDDLRWSSEYETEEFAKRYFERLANIAQAEETLKNLSLRYLLNFSYNMVEESGDETAGELLDRIRSFLDDKFIDIEDDISERLHELDCRDLSEEIGFDEEVCHEIEKYSKFLEEMRKHAPIPGTEEEYEEKMREYERMIERLYDAIDEYVAEYSRDYADELLDSFAGMSYEELIECTQHCRDPAKRDFASDFVEFFREICSDPVFFHYCVEAAAEAATENAR